MAEMQNSDSSCLMEESSDETDIKPWHWAERNAFLWSKNKLSNLLVDLEIIVAVGVIKITEMIKCEGNVVVYSRKNEHKQFYELNLEMKWVGETRYGVMVQGKVAVPHLTEMDPIENTDIVTYYVDDRSESSYFGVIMKTVGVEMIKERLSSYIAALKNDFPKYPDAEAGMEMVVEN